MSKNNPSNEFMNFRRKSLHRLFIAHLAIFRQFMQNKSLQHILSDFMPKTYSKSHSQKKVPKRKIR